MRPRSGRTPKVTGLALQYSDYAHARWAAGLFPCTPHTVEHISRVTSMDRTESTVRKMLTAIEAPLYDIGVLSDRGMLPGLDSIRAAAVLDRLSLLKHSNARGSHIYIRPSGEHRFTTLDDLNEASLARLSADGFTPCAVVETSASNFQAWLLHSRMFPKLVGTLAAQTLAERYNADLSAADWRRFGTVARLYQLQTEIQKAGRPLPFRAPAQP
jgi:RepB DNA-primase from phage plasmid